MCLSVLELGPAENATNAFSSKYKYEKLVAMGPVVKKKIGKLVISGFSSSLPSCLGKVPN